MRTAVAIARAALRRGPVALAYHSVGDSPVEHDPEFLRVCPSRFRQQLELLVAAGGAFTTVTELAAKVRERRSTAGDVVVTFDDGYQDNHEIALPIMRELGVTGTVFVATGLIGRPSPWMSERAGIRMMETHELRELAAAGVELGAHTVTHPDLTTVDPAVCAREVADSKSELEAVIDQPVTSFAYPYFHYDEQVRSVVEASGFEAAVAGLGAGSPDDTLALPRVLVTGKDGLPSFAARIAGVYDPLFQSRAGTLARGATRPLRRLARGAMERRRWRSAA